MSFKHYARFYLLGFHQSFLHIFNNMRHFLGIGTICVIQKNVKKTYGGMLILVKLQAYIPLWVFFMFLNLYEWYQIAQSIT